MLNHIIMDEYFDLMEKTRKPQGPICTFIAGQSYSPTGLTWKQLAEREELMGVARLRQMGVESPSPEMLYGNGIRYIRKPKVGTENEFIVDVEHFNTSTKEMTVYVSDAIGYDEERFKIKKTFIELVDDIIKVLDREIDIEITLKNNLTTDLNICKEERKKTKKTSDDLKKRLLEYSCGNTYKQMILELFSETSKVIEE